MLDDGHGAITWVSWTPVGAGETLDDGEVGSGGTGDAEVEVGLGVSVGQFDESDLGCVICKACRGVLT